MNNKELMKELDVHYDYAQLARTVGGWVFTTAFAWCAIYVLWLAAKAAVFAWILAR